MKKVSWEIIIAGLFFVGVAIYLLGKPPVHKATTRVSAIEKPDTPPPPPKPSQVHVIDLQQLESLSNLKELEELEKLEDLKHLEKLKDLAHLIPAQTRDEFLTEIDKAVREYSNDEVSINIDLNDKLIVVNRDFSDAVPGTWTKTSPGVFTYFNEFDASSISSAALDIPFGSISVVGTREPTGKFTVQASGDINSVTDLQAQFSASANVTGEKAAFIITQDSTSDFLNVQLQVTLYIPEATALAANTSAGHIEVTNLRGEQVFETGGGHIKLARINGKVTAVSEGGHIYLNNSEGDFMLRSAGGHIFAKNCVGKTVLSTTGGNVEAKNVDGEIIASTNGGNVMVFVNKAGHDITAETSAGNVVISIPSGTAANIEAKASSSVDISGINFEGNKSKTQARGLINGGGNIDITAYSKFGNVVIKKND